MRNTTLKQVFYRMMVSNSYNQLILIMQSLFESVCPFFCVESFINKARQQIQNTGYLWVLLTLVSDLHPGWRLLQPEKHGSGSEPPPGGLWCDGGAWRDEEGPQLLPARHWPLVSRRSVVYATSLHAHHFFHWTKFNLPVDQGAACSSFCFVHQRELVSAWFAAVLIFNSLSGKKTFWSSGIRNASKTILPGVMMRPITALSPIRPWRRCFSVRHGCHRRIRDQRCLLWDDEGERHQPGGGAGWWDNHTHSREGQTPQVHTHTHTHENLSEHALIIGLVEPIFHLHAKTERPQQATTWPTSWWAQREPWASSPRPLCVCTESQRPWCRPSALSLQSRLPWTAQCRFCKPECPLLASVRHTDDLITSDGMSFLKEQSNKNT